MSSKKLEATFDCATWEEKDIPTLKDDDTKFSMRITRTRTERNFTGSMNGKGVAEYSFVYYPSGAPPAPTTTTTTSSEPTKEAQEVFYNGLMYFKGKIEGVEGDGEVVLECVNGSWGKGGEMKAICEWRSIPGTGVGAFKDLTIKGGYESTGKITPCWIQLE